MAFGSEFTLDWSVLTYPSEIFIYKILASNLIESVARDLNIFKYAGYGISGLTIFPIFCFFFFPPWLFFFLEDFSIRTWLLYWDTFFFVYLLLPSHPHSFIHSFIQYLTHSFIHSVSHSFIHLLIDSYLLAHIFFSSFSPWLIHSLNLYKQNMKRHL